MFEITYVKNETLTEIALFFQIDLKTTNMLFVLNSIPYKSVSCIQKKCIVYTFKKLSNNFAEIFSRYTKKKSSSIKVV